MHSLKKNWPYPPPRSAETYTHDAYDLQRGYVSSERRHRCQRRVQGAHQIQGFTGAVPRSGVILIGDFVVAGCWLSKKVAITTKDDGPR